MRIQLTSDVHTEFHSDYGRSFINTINPDDLDVLVIAGDFVTLNSLDTALAAVCSRFVEKHVIYVTGNHEYYHAGWNIVDRRIADIAKANPHFHYLNDSSVTIDGQRFIGGALWYGPGDGKLSRLGLNDFIVIKNFEPEVYTRNSNTIDYLEQNVVSTDIVVTHHLPHPTSIAPIYAGNPLNQCFLTDMSSLIERVSPKLWFHGHTHNSLDYVASNSTTRVICNPFGYSPIEINQEYIENLIIEA